MTSIVQNVTSRHVRVTHCCGWVRNPIRSSAVKELAGDKWDPLWSILKMSHLNCPLPSDFYPCRLTRKFLYPRTLTSRISLFKVPRTNNQARLVRQPSHRLIYIRNQPEKIENYLFFQLTIVMVYQPPLASRFFVFNVLRNIYYSTCN